jgi:thymidylate synthase (FAD)
MKVKLVTETKGVGDLEEKDLEGIIAYIARVSNPKNQNNEKIDGLLKFCTKHKHWSVFESCYLGFEIETTMPIAAQLLRHRSATFQQFSGRYSEHAEFELVPARRQDPKNRQNSIDDLPDTVKDDWECIQKQVWEKSINAYNWALEQGIAKEVARMVLPANTKTKLYMTNNVRNWILYLTVRTAHGTQREHIDVANEIQRIITERYPLLGKLIEHTKKVDQYAYDYSITEEI